MKRVSETAMLNAAALAFKAATQSVPTTSPASSGDAEPAAAQQASAKRAPLAMHLTEKASTVGNISMEEMLARAQGGQGVEPFNPPTTLASSVAAPQTEALPTSGAPMALDPNRIGHSKLANRISENFAGEEFETLKADIYLVGKNVTPIKVRRVQRNDGVDYEIVYGHRRHAACKQLGIPVIALVEEMDDREHFLQMEMENRSKKNLSAWEQGLMYETALSLGLFPSNKQLAEACRLDVGLVGKALRIFRLPAQVVEAFASPLHIQFAYAKPLGDAVEENLDIVLSRASEIQQSGKKLKPAKVLALLLGIDQGLNGSAPKTFSPVVIKGNASSAAKILFNSDTNSIAVNITGVDEKRLSELEELVTEFLKK